MTDSLTPTPQQFDPATSLPAEVGGFRLVRMMATGQRALTVLIHAEGETRVARVFHAHCALPVIDAEVAVHDALRVAPAELRQHVAELDDLVTLSDGRLALLLHPVTGPTLGDLVARRRGALAVGEAVTILAPLAAALDTAHDAGLTGLSLSPRGIRFDSAGAPIMLRVQDAVAGPGLPDRLRRLEPAYARDRAVLTRLGETVAAAVREPDRAALLSVLGAASEGRSLTSLLFDLAEPQAVALDDVGEAPPSVAPEPQASVLATAMPAPSPVPPVSAGPLVPGLAMVIDVVGALGLPPGIVDALRRTMEGVSRRLRTATRLRVSRVRPRFALIGASGALALVLALVVGVVTTGAPNDSPVAHAGDGGSESSSVSVETHEPEAPEYLLNPEPDQWQQIVSVLLGRWHDCRRSITQTGEPEAECGVDVVHAHSAAESLLSAHDARHDIVRRWVTEGGEAVVVERMGAAVLVDLVMSETTTASLLMVRSEAGWRVRDVIA